MSVVAVSNSNEVLTEWRATGAEFMVPYFIALQAQIEIKAGDPGAALLLLEAAHAGIERTKERWFAAEVLRLQGEVLLQLGEDKAGFPGIACRTRWRRPGLRARVSGNCVLH